MKKLLVLFSVFISGFSLQAQVDAWTLYMTPGTVHKQLKPYAGEWKATFSFWSAADVQAQSFDLRAVITPIMDGRFIQIIYNGEMMGMKFEALHYLLYNNVTEKFTHIDLNSFGTGYTSYEGIWNASRKVANLTGSIINPGDKKITGLREVIRFIGPDEIVFEIYDVREGVKEFKSQEIILYRQKNDYNH